MKDQAKLEQNGKPSPEPDAAPRDDAKPPVVEFAAEAPAPAPAPAETVRPIAELPGAKAAPAPVPEVEVKAAAEPIVLRPEPQSEPKGATSSAGYAQAEAFVTLGFSAPVKAASQWHQTAVDLWSENAVALLDLASQLAQARSVSDVIALNSRFAQERFQGFARLSSDYVEFTQRAAQDAGWAAFRFTKFA